MRMHKKRNLEPRMEAVNGLLLARGKPCRNLKVAAEEFRALLNYKEIFGNENPVELEIGCGNGAFIAEKAKRNPAVNFLAVEVCTNVVITAMEKIANEAIENVRFLNIPAEILACYLPEHSVRKIYLNFSTPLPEAGREKQRLTSCRFLNIYRALLTDGGEIEQKTDSRPFFDYSLRQYRENGFAVAEQTYDLHASEFAKENIVTEYERRFLNLGMKVCYCRAVLCARSEKLRD